MASPSRRSRGRKVDVAALFQYGLDESHVGTHGCLAVWFDPVTGQTEVTYVADFTHYPPFRETDLLRVLRTVDDRARVNTSWNTTPETLTFGVATPDDLDEEEMRALQRSYTKMARGRGLSVSVVRGDSPGDVLLVLNRARVRPRAPRTPTRRRLFE